MAHTNATPNYSLPQFVGTDKPAWLTDFNGAMSAIDTAMKANEVSAATATASSAQNATAISAQATAISTLQTKVGALETAQPLDEAQIATNTQNIATNAQNIVQIDNTLGHTSIAGIGDGKVTGAIADLDSRVDVLEDKGGVQVVADGVKTYAELIVALRNLADTTKMSYKSVITIGNNCFHFVNESSLGRDYAFSNATINGATTATFRLTDNSSNAKYISWNMTANGNSIADATNTIPASGTTIKLRY